MTALTGAKPLAAMRQAAIEQVNAAAERARLQYVTPGAAQAMVYLEKAIVSGSFLAQYPTATAALGAAQVDWPLLAAEIGITGASLFEVAQVFQAKRRQWTLLAAQIETIRRGVNIDLAAAQSEAAIDALVAGLQWP